MRVVVEHLLDHNKRVCIIDPKGDWWGLKAGGDDSSTGYPVITFGDFKGGDYQADVPINEESGRHVAELITTGNRPCVIGFRGWFTSHMTKFWVDFAKTLFHSNEGELYLVIDEAQNFAPKGSLSGMEGKAATGLHWTNRLLAEGRGLGINIWVGSQRPQKVHNDTLDGCETLIAMRTVHPAAREALVKWMKGAGDKEAESKILSSIGEMPRGEAWVWSPEIGFGPSRVTFPMFKTFDSFAPPQLQKKVAQKTWADVDLDEVKQKLARVIEEQKSNDPKALRSELGRVRSELMKIQGRVETKEVIKEVPVLKEDEREAILRLDEILGGIDFQQVRDVIGVVRKHLVTPGLPKVSDIRGIVSKLPQFSPLPVKKTSQQQSSNGDVSLGKCERSILTALAQYPQGRTSLQIAVLTGYSVTSGGFANSLGKLRSAGLISRGQPVQITEEGKSALGDPGSTPDRRASLDSLVRSPREMRAFNLGGFG